MVFQFNLIAITMSILSPFQLINSHGILTIVYTDGLGQEHHLNKNNIDNSALSFILKAKYVRHVFPELRCDKHDSQTLYSLLFLDDVDLSAIDKQTESVTEAEGNKLIAYDNAKDYPNLTSLERFLGEDFKRSDIFARHYWVLGDDVSDIHSKIPFFFNKKAEYALFKQLPKEIIDYLLLNNKYYLLNFDISEVNKKKHCLIVDLMSILSFNRQYLDKMGLNQLDSGHYFNLVCFLTNILSGLDLRMMPRTEDLSKINYFFNLLLNSMFEERSVSEVFTDFQNDRELQQYHINFATEVLNGILMVYYVGSQDSKDLKEQQEIGITDSYLNVFQEFANYFDNIARIKSFDKLVSQYFEMKNRLSLAVYTYNLVKSGYNSGHYSKYTNCPISFVEKPFVGRDSLYTYLCFPLYTEQALYREGKVMSHCVADYYNKTLCRKLCNYLSDNSDNADTSQLHSCGFNNIFHIVAIPQDYLSFDGVMDLFALDINKMTKYRAIESIESENDDICSFDIETSILNNKNIPYAEISELLTMNIVGLNNKKQLRPRPSNIQHPVKHITVDFYSMFLADDVNVNINVNVNTRSKYDKDLMLSNIFESFNEYDKYSFNMNLSDILCLNMDQARLYRNERLDSNLQAGINRIIRHHIFNVKTIYLHKPTIDN